MASDFGQPLAWVFLAAFLALSSTVGLLGFFERGVCDVRDHVAAQRLALLLLAPAAAMRRWAEERAQGTFELLFSLPVRPVEAALGKALAGLALVLAAVGLAQLPPLLLMTLAPIDPGQVAAGALGAALVGALYLAAGLVASALARDQVTAFVVGLSGAGALVVLGEPALVARLDGALPRVVVSGLADLGVTRHLEPFSRGLVDTAQVAWFACATLVLLGWSVLLVERREGRRGEPALVAALLVVAGALGAGALGERPARLRLDLTRAGSASLAPSTRELLATLPGQVTIHAYASTDLPPGYEHHRPALRELLDLLEDLRAAAPAGRVVLEVVDPTSGALDLAERERLDERARVEGVRPASVESHDERSVRRLDLWAGLAVLHEGRTPAALPVALGLEDLEAEVGHALRRAVLPPIRVALSGPGAGDYGAARELLSRTCAVEDVELEAEGFVPVGVSVVVHTAPIPASPRAAAALERFVEDGGRLVLLLEGHDTRREGWTTAPLDPGPLGPLLERWGLRLGGLVATASPRPFVFELDGRRLQRAYPWVVDAGPQDDPRSPVLGRVARVAFPYAARVEATGRGATTLLQSAPGWALAGPRDIHPLHDVAPAGPAAPVPLIAAIAREGGGRVVLVGDTDFARDREAAQGSDGPALLANLVDWTLDRRAVAADRGRGGPLPLGTLPRVLGREAPGAIVALCAGVAPALLLALGLGGLALAARRRAARAAVARDAAAKAVA